MNDNNFIIISSDEETNTKNISKIGEESNINTGNVVSMSCDFDSSKKKNFTFTSNDQEKMQCSEVSVIKGIKNPSSRKLNPSMPQVSCDKPIDVSEDAECHTENTKVKTCAELDIDNIKENDNNVLMSDTFKKFMQLVLSLENKEDDKAKLKKKITKYHNLADSKYLESKELNDLLENSICKLIKDQGYLYFVVKEVLDCLLSKRVLVQFKNPEKIKLSNAEGGYKKDEIGKDLCKKEVNLFSDGDVKIYKTIKKLTKVLRKIEKKIKELEETEVDLSDEENSIYLKMQKYRERYCQIYKKLCSYTKQEATGKQACSRKITFNGTKNFQLDRAVETWLNKTKQFPDYASVLKFLLDSKDDLLLEGSEEEIKKLAKDVFAKIGNSLQLRRKYDLWDSLNTFLDNEVDPAASDSALRDKLDLNFQIAAKKEREILNYYADLQVKHQLKPKEVPDEEANESPVESGDDDENELEAVENTLSSKIPVEIYYKSEESNTEDNDEDDCDSSLASDEEVATAESKKSNTCLKGGCDPNHPEKNENEDSGMSVVSKEAICSSVKGVIKRRSGKNVENCDCDEGGAKKRSEREEDKHLKKAKLSTEESCDANSDRELVVLLSDEENNFKSERDDNFKIRKVHQINYAFINNNFNHNSALTADDIVHKRKNTPWSYKSGKVQLRSLSIPLWDLTNIKHITNKYARFREGLEKGKHQESIRLHPFERSRFRYSQLLLPDKVNYHCALKNESGKNRVNDQSKCRQVNKKDLCKPTSNGRRIGAPNSGASAGGNGEDNNEDDGSKKPSDQKRRIDENQAAEDEDENDQEEEEKEGTDSIATERNGNDLVEGQCESGNSETATKVSPDADTSQLQQLAKNPSETKRKSFTMKTKRMPSSGMKVHENSGGPARTSKYVSVKSPYTFKPHPGNMNTAQLRQQQVPPSNTSVGEKMNPNKRRQSTSMKAKTDEEIVKNFLQHSPSSISIRSPRQRITENKLSPSILQAMQTLSRLKGITTTVVRSSCSEKEEQEQEEEVIVLGESSISSATIKNKSPISKPKGNDSFPLPKIVTVQGNVSGFENTDSDGTVRNPIDDKAPCSKRRMFNAAQSPSCSSGNGDRPQQINLTKQPSKNVEYVVLE